MDDIKTIITTEVKELLKQLGVDAGFEVSETDNVFSVAITCNDDPSLLIGKHAEGLLSIQRVLQIILFKKFDSKVEVLVDINDYRERQRGRLEQIADNIAMRVERDNRSSTLRSFNAYERKIIHEYISLKYPNLQTHSEGEEPSRVLIVSSTGGDDSIAALEEEFDAGTSGI